MVVLIVRGGDKGVGVDGLAVIAVRAVGPLRLSGFRGPFPRRPPKCYFRRRG